MARKKPYKEGDWFLVPLDRPPGFFGLGLVARVGRAGILCGYFFGPAVTADPGPEARARLRPSDAILIIIFGDRGLVKDGWPILGSLPDWEHTRDLWPIPEFSSIDMVDSTKAYGRTYNPEDPSSQFTERQISLEEAKQMPQDGLAGHGFIQIRLTRLLSEDRSPSVP